MYAAIKIVNIPVFVIGVLTRHSADLAAAFLYRLTDKHTVEEAVFVVDGYGYSTALARLGLSGQRGLTDRTHLARWFQTFRLQADRF